MNYAEKMKQLKQEIRDLKTSQLTQSSSKASIVIGTLPVNVPQGSNTWTITYEESDDESEPLIEVPSSSYFQIAILKYDENSNTQKLQRYQREAEIRTFAEDFYVISSRPIKSIVRNF